MKWLEQLKSVRAVSTPIVAIETVDPAATACQIGEGAKAPVIWWDCANGPRPITDASREACSATWSDPYAALNLVEALKAAARLPERSMLLIANAHRFLEEPAVMQAVANLRDAFRDGRTIILLMLPGARIPQELAQDVLVLERPLPEPAELLPIVDEIAKAASEQLGQKMPSKDVRAKAAEALVGLGEFAAESALSLAVRDGGLAPEALWNRKRAMINQTPGLTLVPAGVETFDQVGGLAAIREFGAHLFGSGTPPRLIVWVDELEKALAGAGGGSSPTGDSSGTSQDQLGVLLRYQEENGWGGILLVGPPGSGKSMFAKALGASHSTPTVLLDLGAMKGSLVGQSELRIRTAMRIIEALAGREALFVATCNRLEAIPPELRRRYRYGIWFTDLPDTAERDAIWKIHLVRNGILPSARPGDPAWTGAEIRNCCDLAARLKITPEKAQAYIVPVSQSDPEGIDRLRRAADGRFLSASVPGPYQMPGGVRPMKERRRLDAL